MMTAKIVKGSGNSNVRYGMVEILRFLAKFQSNVKPENAEYTMKIDAPSSMFSVIVAIAPTFLSTESYAAKANTNIAKPRISISSLSRSIVRFMCSAHLSLLGSFHNFGFPQNRADHVPVL